MEQDRYFMAPVELFDEGKQVAALSSALVSSNYIFGVLPDTDFARLAFLQRRIFMVKLNDGHYLFGQLVREVGRKGVHYNVRILQSAGDPKAQIGLFLHHRGFVTPWVRKFPRIPVAPIKEALEVPTKVYLLRVAKETEAPVSNFSYHGMFFQFQCTGLALTEFVGQIITLRMLTSSNIALSGIRARIITMCDECSSRGIITRGLGVRFVHMRNEVRRKYDEMILGVCRSQKWD